MLHRLLRPHTDFKLADSSKALQGSSACSMTSVYMPLTSAVTRSLGGCMLPLITCCNSLLDVLLPLHVLPHHHCGCCNLPQCLPADTPLIVTCICCCQWCLGVLPLLHVLFLLSHFCCILLCSCMSCGICAHIRSLDFVGNGSVVRHQP